MTGSRKQIVGTLGAMILSGIAVGWHVGLSASPTVSTVVSSLLAVVVSLASVLAGISIVEGASPLARLNVSPWPIAMLSVGLAAGSSIGLYARTHNWLGSSARPSNPADPRTDGVLFDVPAPEHCEALAVAAEDSTSAFQGALADHLDGTALTAAKRRFGELSDPKISQRAVVREICRTP